MYSKPTSSTSDCLVSSRSILLALFVVLLSQVIYTNIRQMVASFERIDSATEKSQNSRGLEKRLTSLEQGENLMTFAGVMFAEAGKKKKKEKSEVVVISVNNPSKGHAQPYPIFIPSCGGHSGGYGRRKRSVIV